MGITRMHKRDLILKSAVKDDEITRRISQMFDYKHDGYVEERITIPTFPDDYQIGLIVGSSGSGKTTILKSVWGG